MTAAPSPDWVVEEHVGPAGELHAREHPDDGVRRVWVLAPTRPAVVLGSTQRDDVVDHAAAAAVGVDVARRRSGGGAVWVAPGDPLWIDVLVPRGDPLWDDDVGRSFLPVGAAFARALGALGVPDATVHQGALRCTPHSRLVCFAGTGTGEVLVGERKLVGISQRRTRAGARFQCAIPRRWDPEPLRAVLADPPPPGALDRVGVGLEELGVDPGVDRLVRLVTAGLTDREPGPA